MNALVVIAAMWLAGWLVFIVHCNIWYWGLLAAERARLDAEDGLW